LYECFKIFVRDKFDFMRDHINRNIFCLCLSGAWRREKSGGERGARKNFSKVEDVF
jgi:hypothetical protein